jgi:CheY-like chemotaxis protein
MSARKRLVIVDDDAAVLEVLREYFGPRYEVETSRTAAGGMFAAIRARPDVILLDVKLPGMTGLELAAGIRTNGGTAPIVFMTGYLSARVEAEARRLGAVACLQKPTDLLKLDAIVSDLAHRDEPSTA